MNVTTGGLVKDASPDDPPEFESEREFDGVKYRVRLHWKSGDEFWRGFLMRVSDGKLSPNILRWYEAKIARSDANTAQQAIVNLSQRWLKEVGFRG